MLKKTVKYTDFNGNQREEDLYFNLTNAELMEMEMSTEGGLSTMYEKIVKTQDVPSIIKVFKDLILKSYGEKSADGKRFVKINENGTPLSLIFSQTEAYSELFMELATDPEKASEFFIGVMPKDAAEAAKKEMAKQELLQK